MPGLNLMGMGGVRTSSGGYSSAPNPATASQAAFGAGGSTGKAPSTANALLPNDPFGVALWTSIIAVGLLMFIRHSLPA